MTPREAQAAAWLELQRASGLAENSPKEAWTLLSEAAQKYAKARWAAQTQKSPVPAKTGHVIPFGNSKGTPLHEAETKDLRWVASALRESLDDPAKERWRGKNAELLEAIEAELEAR